MSLAGAARAVASRARPYVPALVASSALALASTRAIVSAAGHPAAPLDDAFIHFQYAKRLAQGAFFGYAPGGGYTTGATSLLWPLVLAPFHAIGFRDLSILYVAWFFGTLAHAALAVETARVARRLTGRATGTMAGVMCLAFGAHAWFAWSGMETIPLAWILMRCARLAGELCEPDPDEPGRRSATALARSLALAGLAAPLLRPEGILGAAVAAAALGLLRDRRGDRHRALAAAPAVGVLLVPALHLALAGHAASSTALVKWLALNPYLDRAAFLRTVWSNVELLVGNLLDGGDWSTLFLPEGCAALFLLGLPALVLAARRRRAPGLAIALGVIALGVLIPCTYLSLLWNRLRYIWPFTAAHFVLLACLAEEIGQLAKRLRADLGFVGPALAGGFAGALVTHLPWCVRDLAQSAAAVDQQQVALGRWAAANLPADARIGVNDTGAIAYLGGRATFDLVGLTTEGEARYWVAGPGSRFEHYEKLSPELLPTHFIVYPTWMACPALLGRELTEATVIDQSILGGTTMIAYEARWSQLGTGAAPLHPHAGAALDELDVSDLESERAHRYLLGRTNEVSDLCATALTAGDAGPRPISDGGRFQRTREAFTLGFGGARRARLVARLGAERPVSVAVSVAGVPQGAIDVPAAMFGDLEIDVESPGDTAKVELVAPEGSEFSSFHYWLFPAPG